MSDPITAALIMSAATLTASGVSASVSHDASKSAEWQQKQAQNKAEATQKAADEKAEQERLAALAKNQQTQGFDFGVDSALAKRYADAAQKWGAGTGSMTEDEDNNNPFYTRGLI